MRNLFKQVTVMIHVGVGSTNPAKVDAVQEAFAMMGLKAKVMGIKVESGVSGQPFSDEETVAGAVNRARAVLDRLTSCDYAVGLEGGVARTPYGLFLCNWGAVINREGIVGIGGGHRLQLPGRVAHALDQGWELGEILAQMTGRKEARKKEGMIGILTNNLLTRKGMYRDLVLCAFSRFLRPDLYGEETARIHPSGSIPPLNGVE